MTLGDSEQSPSSPGSIADLTLNWAKANHFRTWFSRQTTSTNTVAKSRVSSAIEKSMVPTLFLTERQTAGRGRGEHTWSTPEGALLSTWSYPLAFAPQPILSPLVGLALFEACARAFPGVAFNLKAPNDLFVSDKKIAGLLIETVMMGDAVTCAVGLGFNAGETPASLATQAVGLAQCLPAEMIAAQWPVFLSSWYEGLGEALSQARVSELAFGVRERLREALNLHPLLKESVLNVGPLGQIQTASRLIHWHEL